MLIITIDVIKISINMRQCRMLVLCFLFIFITFTAQPTFAQNQKLEISTGFTYNSAQFLGIQNDLRSPDKSTSKFDIKYNTDKISSKLALNYDGYNNFTLDRSFFQYISGIATFGVGAIDRNWSFSDKTSIILSQNARPINSIYMKLNSKVEYNWMPSKTEWSFEIFNGLTKGSLNSNESMLLGARAVLSPFEGLNFELVQTSQWGGESYSSGISSLGAALISDTNNSANSNINKMAGFGISYLFPSSLIPIRIYGQAIGEDEAGNLPSCYAYFTGLEWTNTKIRYPTIITVEAIDTRTDRSINGYCGSNTFYNNGTYNYTNYNKTMGAEIDTEGTSFGLYVKSQLSKDVNIEYSTKSVVINDNNWLSHRLSSNRQSGLINSISISWIRNNITFNGNIYNQDFSLNKANINSGYGIGFSSSIMF